MSEDPKLDFKFVNKISDDMWLGRNSLSHFWRILRRKNEWKNSNTDTYGVRCDYQSYEQQQEFDSAKFLEHVQRFKDDPKERLSPKTDKPPKTNVADSPGFGSVRLVPPYEEANYDQDFFDFCQSMVGDGDVVADFGGGAGWFMHFLKGGKRRIVFDKNKMGDVLPSDTEYIDSDDIFPVDVLFAFHVLEHLDNPEEMIRMFSKSKVFIFATPNQEVLENSIHHYVFMEMGIFKGIFKELGVPVVACSQLSRQVEQRGGEKRPQLSDLRESGAIEQDADVVVLLLRDEYYNPNVEEKKGLAEIIIAKQRNGPVGTLNLAFISEYTRFENLSRREEE